MNEFGSVGDSLGSLGSYGDKPDPLIASARPEFQYGLLAQILQPMVDEAVKIVNDEEQQLRLIFRPLIKYGQKCIREQRGWLTQIINQLLMDARTQVNQTASNIQTVQNIFNDLANSKPGRGDDDTSRDDGKPPGGEGERPPSSTQPPTGTHSNGLSASVSSGPQGTVYQVQFPIRALPPTSGAVSDLHQGASGQGEGGSQAGRQGQPPTAPGGAVGGASGPTAAGQTSVGTTPQGGPTAPPGAVVVNVHVPPCPAPRSGEGSGDKPGEGDVPEEGGPDIEGPVLEPQKDPLVAAPAPDGEPGEGGKGGAGTKLPNLLPFRASLPNLCQDVETAIEQFAALGIEILAWVAKTVDSLTDRLEVVGTAVIDAAIQGGAGAPIRIALTLAAAKDAIRFAGAVIGSMYTQRSKSLIGMYAVRSLLQMIESAQVGADLKTLSITASVSFHFEYPGLREIIEYLINYLQPIRLPSTGDLLEMVRTTRMTRDEARCLWQLGGNDPAIMDLMADGRRSKMDEFGLARELFRFHRNPERVWDEFRERGWSNRDEAERFLRNAEFIPPPTDAIMWTVREVFSTVDIGNKEVLEEYAGQVGLSEVLRLSGVVPITFRPENPAPLMDLLTKHQKAVPWLTKAGKDEIRMDVPLMYWAAHYDHVSPMQAYEMMHRLRPNRVKRYPLRDEKGNITFPEPFDIEGVRGLLRLKDYHPIWRDRLASISYRPLGRIDTRRIYAAGGFGDPKGLAGFKRNPDDTVTATGDAEKEIVEQYRDQGYAEVDAVRLAMFTAQEFDKADVTGRRKKAITMACRSFKSGIIDRDQYFKLLEKAGVPLEQSIALVDNCETELDYEQAIESIKAVRKMFLRGIIDVPTVRGFLANIGVVSGRIDRYISLWAIELKGREKSIPASEMSKWYIEGLITKQEFYVRLLNIGYLPADAARVIRHAEIGEMAKGKKAAEARAKAAAKEAKARFAHRSEKFMMAAFKAKQLNAVGIFNTLLSQGWPARDAQTWIRANLKVNVDGSPFTPPEEETSKENDDATA